MKRLLSWSGGKDAAFALLTVRDVDALLVTYDESTGEIPIHNVPLAKIEAQAASLELPLVAVPLPPRCPNEVYIARMRDVLVGVEEVVFGDLFLEDIRAWRQEFLAGLGVRASFPLFGRDSATFAREIIDAGIVAVVCAVDATRLDRSFVGRTYDRAFLADLPAGVDPCGERGEFHTFVEQFGDYARWPFGRRSSQHLKHTGK